MVATLSGSLARLGGGTVGFDPPPGTGKTMAAEASSTIKRLLAGALLAVTVAACVGGSGGTPIEELTLGDLPESSQEVIVHNCGEGFRLEATEQECIDRSINDEINGSRAFGVDTVEEYLEEFYECIPAPQGGYYCGIGD